MTIHQFLTQADNLTGEAQATFGDGSYVHRAAQLLYREALNAVCEEEEREAAPKRWNPPLSDEEDFRAVWAGQQRAQALAMAKEL